MIEWYPSRSLLGWWAQAVSGCLVLVALCCIEPRASWHWLLLAALIVAYVVDAVGSRRAAVLRGFALQQGHWYVLIDAERVAVELEASHFISQHLGVLRFRTAAGTRHKVALLPDSLSGEARRQLAVALGG